MNESDELCFYDREASRLRRLAETEGPRHKASLLELAAQYELLSSKVVAVAPAAPARLSA